MNTPFSSHSKPGPRDFFLYILAIICLYVSLGMFLALVFRYIAILFPDRLEWHDASLGDVRFFISTLLVLFPVYVGITWFLKKDLIEHPEKRDFPVRKTLIAFTLFLAALAIIIDLVMLINSFLQGELSVRFFLKVITVFVTAGAVFGYYFRDMRKEFSPKDRPSRVIAGTALAVVLGSIVAGFFIIGSPFKARILRFDETRVSDLQNIQWQVVNFWQQKGRIPETLDALKDDISGNVIPVDPITGTPYEYRVKAAHSFELCADFSLASKDRGGLIKPRPLPGGDGMEQWDHPAGRACFSRNIDPERYPRIKVKD